MARESIIIGDKEYGVSKLGAFEANGIILKLQKLILPVIGEVAGGGSNVMNMDISKAFQIISQQLDESVMTDIILPTFKLAQVASITDNIKIDSSVNINKVFIDADGLADFYVLVFEVLKYNYGGFFQKMLAHFGDNAGIQKVVE